MTCERCAKLEDILRRLLSGFQDEIWVRNILHDGKEGWLIRIIPHVRTLAEAATEVSEEPTQQKDKHQ